MRKLKSRRSTACPRSRPRSHRQQASDPGFWSREVWPQAPQSLGQQGHTPVSTSIYIPSAQCFHLFLKTDLQGECTPMLPEESWAQKLNNLVKLTQLERAELCCNFWPNSFEASQGTWQRIFSSFVEKSVLLSPSSSVIKQDFKRTRKGCNIYQVKIFWVISLSPSPS